MLRIVNVEQKLLALESLLEKVRTNAAKPRPARGAAIAASQPATAASRATDDVAGPAVAAAPIRVAPAIGTPGAAKFGDDEWGDTTETFDTPVPLAAPLLQSLAKAPATKPTPAKPIAATTTPKPLDTVAAKPTTPTAPAKPVIAPPTIKPVVATPAVKPVLTTPTAKPTTPQNSPIPLTNKVPPPVIKTPAIPAAAKPIETTVNKTLTGVGDGAVKAPEIRAGAVAAGISLPITGEPPAVEPIVELEKKAAPAKPEADRKPSLPSAFADADGEEENEPTQLYEPSAASRRAMELAAMSEKQLDDAKKSLGIDKKPDGDKVAIHLPDAKDTSDKIEVKAPKIELPWVENTERKIDPEKIGLAKPDDKPGKKGPSRTELDLELVASQEGALETVDLDVNEKKDEKKPEPAIAAPPVLETKPQAVVEPPPISEKKPVVESKPVVETKPTVDRKPIATAEPVLEQPSKPSKGTSPLVILVALVLLLAAGAFVAMKQGWIGGGSATTNPTVAPPTNPTPTATQTAAPTATQTATATATNAAPADSAAAAPADSAAAPADSAAAAPADSAAAAPPASASAAAEPATPPATAGTPSVDPATLNNNQGLIFVTANKPARVYLTGKLAGDTNTELKVDCGLKFVRLADPAQDIAKPPMWLTAGEPKQIDCRKYTTFTVNVP